MCLPTPHYILPYTALYCSCTDPVLILYEHTTHTLHTLHTAHFKQHSHKSVFSSTYSKIGGHFALAPVLQ